MRVLGVAVALAVYTAALVVLAFLADDEEDHEPATHPRQNVWPHEEWRA